MQIKPGEYGGNSMGRARMMERASAGRWLQMAASDAMGTNWTQTYMYSVNRDRVLDY